MMSVNVCSFLGMTKVMSGYGGICDQDPKSGVDICGSGHLNTDVGVSVCKVMSVYGDNFVGDEGSDVCIWRYVRPGSEK